MLVLGSIAFRPWWSSRFPWANQIHHISRSVRILRWGRGSPSGFLWNRIRSRVYDNLRRTPAPLQPLS